MDSQPKTLTLNWLESSATPNKKPMPTFADIGFVFEFKLD